MPAKKHSCMNCGYSNPAPQKPVVDPNAPVAEVLKSCKTCGQEYTESAQAHAKDEKHKLVKQLLKRLQDLPCDKLNLVQIQEAKVKPPRKGKCLVV